MHTGSAWGSHQYCSDCTAQTQSVHGRKLCTGMLAHTQMLACSMCPVRTSQPTATQAPPDILQDYLHQGTRIVIESRARPQKGQHLWEPVGSGNESRGGLQGNPTSNPGTWGESCSRPSSRAQLAMHPSHTKAFSAISQCWGGEVYILSGLLGRYTSARHFPQGCPPPLGCRELGASRAWFSNIPPLCPPALPSCKAPATRAAWLPRLESSARSPVAVRRHPGWHPGLTPDASPPPAGKTLSSAPTHGLPPGLPPALQQETRRCTELPHRQHLNHEVHGAHISPPIPAHSTIMKSCIPRRSRVEKDESYMVQPVLQ